MLARNFKTAAELGISGREHRALIAVLYQLERGELDNDFNMACWNHCICGHARKFDEQIFSFPFPTDTQDALTRLFYFTNSGSPVSTAHAAQALNNYLVTGEPDWDSVMFPVADPTLCRSRSA